MIAILLVTMIHAAAKAPASDIVVTGKRLGDAYAECVARRCSPQRDAQVSIAWAEQAFRKGDYIIAKRGLAAAVARNRNAAATAPKPVSALYEAYATVSLQEGDIDVYRSAVSAQVRTLRDNLPMSDPAVSDAESALGDMWMKAGDTRNARAAYERAQRNATAQHHDVVALSAGLRLVTLASEQGRAAEAARLLDEVAGSRIAQDASLQAIMPAFRLRLAVKRADKADIDRQIAALAKVNSGARPIMIWNPALEPVAATAAQDHANSFGDVNRSITQSMITNLKWADIGYWIRPDGRTDDIAVLRTSGDDGWTRTAVQQINGRRYAAFAANGAGQGVYRIERYTLRGAGYEVPKGSLIRQRVAPERMEVLDITGATDAPTTPTS